MQERLCFSETLGFPNLFLNTLIHPEEAITTGVLPLFSEIKAAHQTTAHNSMVQYQQQKKPSLFFTYNMPASFLSAALENKWNMHTWAPSCYCWQASTCTSYRGAGLQINTIIVGKWFLCSFLIIITSFFKCSKAYNYVFVLFWMAGLTFNQIFKELCRAWCAPHCMIWWEGSLPPQEGIEKVR